MVKESSKKLKVKEAEKVKEVIVKKVVEPVLEAPEPTIKEEGTTTDALIKELSLSEMPEEVEKPKKKSKKLIKTGRESKARLSEDLSDEAFKKVVGGSPLGLYAGIGLGILLGSAGIYYIYTKYFKKDKKIEEVKEEDIKSLSAVKEVKS
jgi:hypothetical protein